MITLISFASVALLLTLVGLYGLLSYAVRQRTAEIGLRMAVGASYTSVLGMIIRYGLRLTTTGLLVGLCFAFALMRGMAHLLYGISAIDPVTFSFVPVLLVIIALLVCMAPAWRAVRIDPVRALRQQ